MNTGNAASSQSQITQPRMIIRPSPKRPEKLPFRFVDRQIINTGKTPLHQTLRVELPSFDAKGTKPLSAIVMPLVGKPHRHAIQTKSP